MSLKIGGSDVGKIMYNGQEFGGATKLEPGTILYIAEFRSEKFENAHLLSTTKKWENINGIIISLSVNGVLDHFYEANISGDDFKSLDTGKKYDIDDYRSMTVSRSIIDGEYRLNVSGYKPNYYLVVRAI